MKDKTPADQDKQIVVPHEPSVNSLYQAISEIVDDARKTVYRATNQAIVRAYWEIGRVIVEEEQEDREKAVYGKGIIRDLFPSDQCRLRTRLFAQKSLVYEKLLHCISKSERTAFRIELDSLSTSCESKK